MAFVARRGRISDPNLDGASSPISVAKLTVSHQQRPEGPAFRLVTDSKGSGIQMTDRLFAFLSHRIVVNTFYLLLTRVATFAAPLLALWHLLGVLGLDVYGVVAFGVALVALATMLTDFGLTLVAIQKVSVNRDKKRFLGRLMGGVVGVKILTSVALSVPIVIYALISTKYAEYRLLLLILPLSIGLIALQPSWLFFGLEKSGVFAWIMIGGKSLYLIAIFALVRSPSDYYFVPIADSIGTLAIVIASYSYIHRFGIRFRIPSPQDLIYVFKRGVGFFMAQVATAAYQNTAVIILGLFSPPAAVAIFAVAEQFYKALGQLFSPLSLALYPYMSREKDFVLFLRIIAGVSVILVLFLFIEPFAGPFVFGLLKVPKPGEVQSIMAILMIGLIFHVINAVSGYPLFTIFDRLDIANSTLIVGAGAFFVLVAIYVAFGVVGPFALAWAIVVAELCILSARVYFCYRLRLVDKRGRTR